MSSQLYFLELERDKFILLRAKDLLDQVPDAVEMLKVYNNAIENWIIDSHKSDTN